MSQPDPYNPFFNFEEESDDLVAGRTPIRPDALDAELAAIALSLSEIIFNLGIIQRDDTALRDGIVTPISLSEATLTLLGSSAGSRWTPRGLWLTATAYELYDFVEDTGSSYLCLVDHTSGVFATDHAAGKWMLVGQALGSLTAADVPFVGAGTIAASNVQAAIEEAASEAAQKSANGSDFSSAATVRSNLGVVAKAGDTFTGPVGFDAGSQTGAVNVGLKVDINTPNAGDMTITLTGADGNALSASNPASIPLRSSASGTGTQSSELVTSPVTLVVPNGARLGAQDNEPVKLWLIAGEAGALAVANPVAGNAFNVLRFDTNSIQRLGVSAIGTGSDSGQTFYANSSDSTFQYCVIGNLYWPAGMATAGVWGTAPTSINLWQPGLPLPGDIIQTQYGAFDSGVATGATPVPNDNTTPTSSEGDQYMNLPTFAAGRGNIVDYEALGHFATSNTDTGITMFIRRNGSTVAVARGSRPATAGVVSQVRAHFREICTINGNFDVTVRAGTSSAGTTTFNGSAGAGLYNGSLYSWLKVTEICA